MKKIILWVLMFFIYFIWQNTLLTFANTKDEERTKKVQQNEQRIKEIDEKLKTTSTESISRRLLEEKQKLQKETESMKSSQEREAACASSGDCIDEASFMIETSLFSDGGKGLKWESSKATINTVLWTLIQKLMIALWIISLLIMTIGAGYMILYHGEDEYLSKWKSIFIAGIISLIVALSSYYIVNLVAYILYK